MNFKKHIEKEKKVKTGNNKIIRRLIWLVFLAAIIAFWSVDKTGW